MADIMLTIIMSNYNQEKYIKKAIDSVLSQNVNFKYELIITDDNSQKDNSVSIIKEYAEKYPEIIKPIFNKENGGYLKNILRAKAITKTPYFCLLDADDYYTDFNFLQRSFDFLQNNQDYIIYYENVTCLYEDGVKKPFISTRIKSATFDINDYLNDCLPIVQTTGQFYRNVIFSKGIPEIMQKSIGTDSERSFEGDFDRFIMHLKYGKAYFNNISCGIYRILSTGIWSKLSSTSRHLLQLQCYYDYDRYFEGLYRKFFINKMYQVAKCILSDMNYNILSLQNINITEHMLLQFNFLYDFIISNKSLIEKQKHMIIKKMMGKVNHLFRKII